MGTHTCVCTCVFIISPLPANNSSLRDAGFYPQTEKLTEKAKRWTVGQLVDHLQSCKTYYSCYHEEGGSPGKEETRKHKNHLRLTYTHLT